MSKQKLALELACNNLSFGNVSYLILRTIYDRIQNGDDSIEYSLFPIGNVDFSNQKNDDNFNKWLNSLIIKALETHSRHTPLFKVWHTNGAMPSCSNKQTLLTFYELDNPTRVELNTLKNQHKVLLTSKFSNDVFNLFGLKTEYVPLAFDSYNYSTLNKVYNTDGRIVFNLLGKFEKRKAHVKVIQAWIKKFGNNPKYALQCAIYNPFLNAEQNNQLIGQAVGGNKPFNVTFYPIMKENAVYNDFLNSADVVIDMSGAESFSLPSFHSVALGKHAVILNAHVFKDWATNENAVLVNPNGKEPVYDNMFFQQGSPYNQGNIFSWNEDDFINGCNKAIERVQLNKVNTEGLKLQQEFTKEKLVDSILSHSLS
jgi:hypothetical protein